jgi:hypothetical protein
MVYGNIEKKHINPRNENQNLSIFVEIVFIESCVFSQGAKSPFYNILDKYLYKEITTKNCYSILRILKMD